MKTDHQVIAQRDDVEFMERPHLWPHWPWLPVKRRNKDKPHDFPECGFLIEGAGLVVYLGTIFGAGQADKLEKLRYDSAQQCVAAGWVVD